MLEWINGGLLLGRVIYQADVLLGLGVRGSRSIVLVALPGNVVTPFVTWDEVRENGRLSGQGRQASYAMGHYHKTIEEAADEYAERHEGMTHAKANEAAITQRATDDAKAAASWFDMDLPRAAKVLAGIDDGDPEILDQLPHARLGGEFADDPTWEDIYKEEIGEPYPMDGADELCTLYEDVFSHKVVEFIEAAARETCGQYD